MEEILSMVFYRLFILFFVSFWLDVLILLLPFLIMLLLLREIIIIVEEF